MKIQLSTLVEACECMRQMREAEGEKLSTADFMRYLRAWSKFKIALEMMTENQQVEVTQ